MANQHNILIFSSIVMCIVCVCVCVCVCVTVCVCVCVTVCVVINSFQRLDLVPNSKARCHTSSLSMETGRTPTVPASRVWCRPTTSPCREHSCTDPLTLPQSSTTWHASHSKQLPLNREPLLHRYRELHKCSQLLYTRSELSHAYSAV